jgi:electron transfer flavoprotein alpha subunit
MSSGVMIFGEILEGKLASVTAELLGCGRKLADDLGQELSAVLAGSGVAAFAPQAISAGANKVYVVDDPLLADYQTEPFVAVMEKVIKQADPQVVLLSQTAVGRDLAPRLAFRLGTAATMDCIAVSIDPQTRKLVPTKPVYGGNARAVLSYETDPQIATVRAKAVAALVPDPSRKGEVVSVAAGLDPAMIRAKVVQKVKEDVKGIKLEEAPTVVSGGRGIGGAEGFKELEALAKLLKGAVGASRPACDSAWITDSSQIGLTGKIVSPDLYIAVAISGSSQHMAGCSGAKVIVAINKDPEANIFKEARYGVVGDWKKVLPAFTQKLKELLAQ